VKIRIWVGTSRIAGKGLFAAQDIKKGTRIMQYIGQRIAKAETAERFHHCRSRWSAPSSREQPNGDDDPFPVQEATEPVSHPLHPAIFLPE
jgi:hypothetical protein